MQETTSRKRNGSTKATYAPLAQNVIDALFVPEKNGGGEIYISPPTKATESLHSKLPNFSGDEEEEEEEDGISRSTKKDLIVEDAEDYRELDYGVEDEDVDSSFDNLIRDASDDPHQGERTSIRAAAMRQWTRTLNVIQGALRWKKKSAESAAPKPAPLKRVRKGSFGHITTASAAAGGDPRSQIAATKSRIIAARQQLVLLRNQKTLSAEDLEKKGLLETELQTLEECLRYEIAKQHKLLNNNNNNNNNNGSSSSSKGSSQQSGSLQRHQSDLSTAYAQTRARNNNNNNTSSSCSSCSSSSSSVSPIGRRRAQSTAVVPPLRFLS